jgi:ferredoxin
VKRTAGLQLYIDPDLCICGGACVSKCPAEAIFEEEDVPLAHHDSIAYNARFFGERR